MKKIKLILLFIFMISLFGCGKNTSTTDVEPLDSVERDIKNDESNKEIIVQENEEDVKDNITNENQINDQLEQSADTIETTEVIAPTQDDINTSIEEEIFKNDESQVLDLTEVEDEFNYETGLVFIVQEGDYWRVVDRVGNIYRVSTSNSSVKQGIVNLNAIVTKDSEGSASVSLSRDYKTYDSNYIVKAEENIDEVFSTLLLDKQLGASKESKIDSYTIQSVSSEKLGKGIRKITMKFDVKPSQSESLWGSTTSDGYVKDITYVYTIFGYESTWILPIKPPLYNTVNKEVALIIEDEASQESTENLNTNDQSETTSFEASSLQKILYQMDNKTYYSEKELIPQSDDLVGTDMYEHMISLFVSLGDNSKDKLIVKGDKNNNYELITAFEEKLYLIVSNQAPSTGGFLIGIGYVDFTNNSYRTIYKGEVAKGIVIKDKCYMFTNDNMIEIDLVTASIRLVSTLPKHLEFDVNSIKIIGIEDNLLEIEIEYELEAVTYSINVINGETTIVETFVY